MRFAAALAIIFLAPLAAGAIPNVLVPQQGDPDITPVNAPAATVTPFVNERYSFTEGYRTHAIAVPDVPFDRVVLTFNSRPAGDPWDRLVGVAIGGVEVLKATTPRANFTLTKDITEYASVLPRGQSVNVSLYMGTWVGAILASVRIDFYVDEPTAAFVAPPADAVVAAQRWTYIGGTGSVSHAAAQFPDAAPSAATVEARTSGHGQDGEFWYLNAQNAHPLFHVLVDGNEVGMIQGMPYTYALVGLGTGSVVLEDVNEGTWWTEQKAADAAGVHTGVGEIPAYRAPIDSSLLPLLTGSRDVSFVVESGGGTWITSVDFLLTR